MVLPGSGGQAGRRVDPAPTDDMTVLQVRPWSLVLWFGIDMYIYPCPSVGGPWRLFQQHVAQRAQRAQRPAAVCLPGIRGARLRTQRGAWAQAHTRCWQACRQGWSNCTQKGGASRSHSPCRTTAPTTPFPSTTPCGPPAPQRLQADFERKRHSGVPVPLMFHEDYLADGQAAGSPPLGCLPASSSVLVPSRGRGRPGRCCASHDSTALPHAAPAELPSWPIRSNSPAPHHTHPTSAPPIRT